MLVNYLKNLYCFLLSLDVNKFCGQNAAVTLKFPQSVSLALWMLYKLKLIKKSVKFLRPPSANTPPYILSGLYVHEMIHLHILPP